jgi:hypothetical protein
MTFLEKSSKNLYNTCYKMEHMFKMIKQKIVMEEGECRWHPQAYGFASSYSTVPHHLQVLFETVGQFYLLKTFVSYKIVSSL